MINNTAWEDGMCFCTSLFSRVFPTLAAIFIILSTFYLKQENNENINSKFHTCETCHVPRALIFYFSFGHFIPKRGKEQLENQIDPENKELFYTFYLH